MKPVIFLTLVPFIIYGLLTAAGNGYNAQIFPRPVTLSDSRSVLDLVIQDLHNLKTENDALKARVVELENATQAMLDLYPVFAKESIASIEVRLQKLENPKPSVSDGLGNTYPLIPNYPANPQPGFSFGEYNALTGSILLKNNGQWLSTSSVLLLARTAGCQLLADRTTSHRRRGRRHPA